VRVLITGAGGQLGRDLQGALADHDVVALTHAQLDTTDAAAARAAVEHHRPAVVIHAAAMTDTARCEREPDAAYVANALAARNAAVACLETDAAMVYVSTNEVFDGRARTPYIESDDPAPVPVPGRRDDAGAFPPPQGGRGDADEAAGHADRKEGSPQLTHRDSP
jgi:dTDP-4-dehydrorhamnose reductase